MGTELGEPDLAKYSINGPVAVEGHPRGIRATYPKSRVIGMDALVPGTQVGDNASWEQ